jgi:p-hydroxybenzoate 3-monooxygenase
VIIDLVAARVAAQGQLLFKASKVAVHDIASARPWVSFVHKSEAQRIDADFVYVKLAGGI